MQGVPREGEETPTLQRALSGAFAAWLFLGFVVVGRGLTPSALRGGIFVILLGFGGPGRGRRVRQSLDAGLLQQIPERLHGRFGVAVESSAADAPEAPAA